MNAFRRGLQILCAVALTAFSVLASGPAFASEACTEWSWGQPRGTKNVLGLPFWGGFAMPAKKRCKEQVQWLEFGFKAGSLYQEPSAHLAVLLDGRFKDDGNGIPYAARGIAAFRDHVCFERFGAPDSPLSECHQFVFDPMQTYTIILYASDTTLTVWIKDESGLELLTFSGSLPDIMPDESLSLIAIAGVFNECKSTSKIFAGGQPDHCSMTISDVKHGRL